MKQTFLFIPLVLTACVAVSHSDPSTRALAGTVPGTALAPIAAYAQDDAPVSAPVSPPMSTATDKRLALHVGQRSLSDDTFWEPLEDHFVLAVDFAQEAAESPIGWEVGVAFSTDGESIGGIDIDVTTAEFYGGVVKSFMGAESKLRPYVGGGLSYITAEVEALSTSIDDSSIALYVHGGAAFHLTQAFYLGLDVRFLFGSDISLPGFVDTDVDYLQFTGVLGYAF